MSKVTTTHEGVNPQEKIDELRKLADYVLSLGHREIGLLTMAGLAASRLCGPNSTASTTRCTGC